VECTLSTVPPTRLITYCSRCLKRQDKPIACEADESCEKRTAQQKDMDRHYWTTHRPWAEANNIPSTETTCPVCSEVLRRSDYLSKHMDRYHSDKPKDKDKGKKSKGKGHGK
jgi:hypothetical protein